jgi:ribosome biogenesis GTPase
MNLPDLGYGHYLQKTGAGNIPAGFEPGRVVAEHRERYKVVAASGEYDAEVTGNLRFTARSREDFPAVGDWVACQVYGSDLAIIHQVFPRFSIVSRKAVGSAGELQVIAANIDCAFLVQAAGYDFNINRLERYLTICNAARIETVIVLSKADLFADSEINRMVGLISQRIPGVAVVTVSSQPDDGYSALDRFWEVGKTYCLLGSSGVGKSTLLNHLLGGEKMITGDISDSTGKGRHVTSHRELAVLPNGAILIDNPGMREVGVADVSGGIETTFGQIESLASACRFEDCSHTSEAGCAVIAAVERNEIDRHSYENYLKMQKEQAHYNATALEKRQKEKEFGRLMKNYKKDLKKGKF